jgi:hypothetical protein
MQYAFVAWVGAAGLFACRTCRWSLAVLTLSYFLLFFILLYKTFGLLAIF